MDYSELSFALKVRKLARDNMVRDIQNHANEYGVDPTSSAEIMAKMDEMDYPSYVEEILVGAREAAKIIKNLES